MKAFKLLFSSKFSTFLFGGPPPAFLALCAAAGAMRYLAPSLSWIVVLAVAVLTALFYATFPVLKKRSS